MQMEYVVNLLPDQNKLEDYKNMEKNLVEVKIRKSGVNIKPSFGCGVIINLSREAMLGLGTELIRNVMAKNNLHAGCGEEISPIRKNFAGQQLGIYLTPNSCELIVNGGGAINFGTVNEILAKLESEEDSKLDPQILKTWKNSNIKRGYDLSQKEYKVNLMPNEKDLETYEIEDRNLMELKVQIPGFGIVSGINYKVIINLSREAMIGLGTELIREAMRLKKYSNIVLDYKIFPLSLYNTKPKFGIYLTPNSCPLLISNKNLGTIEDLQIL